MQKRDHIVDMVTFKTFVAEMYIENKRWISFIRLFGLILFIQFIV